MMGLNRIQTPIHAESEQQMQAGAICISEWGILIF